MVFTFVDPGTASNGMPPTTCYQSYNPFNIQGYVGTYNFFRNWHPPSDAGYKYKKKPAAHMSGPFGPTCAAQGFPYRPTAEEKASHLPGVYKYTWHSYN